MFWIRRDMGARNRTAAARMRRRFWWWAASLGRGSGDSKSEQAANYWLGDSAGACLERFHRIGIRPSLSKSGW